MAKKAGFAFATVVSIAACGGNPSPHGPAHVCTFFETQLHNWSLNKIDVLFVVDNSPSMGDKAALLAAALPDLLNRLTNPECVDPTGSVVGISSAGRCATGALAHARVRDLHAAIISSSLGAGGGGLCGLNGVGARQNDLAETLNRVGTDEHSVGDAQPSHFLAWFPSVGAGLGQPPPWCQPSRIRPAWSVTSRR